MPRGLTPAQKAEVARRVISPAYFVEISLSPVLRVWTGAGTATVGGFAWSGVHEFAAIEGLESGVSRKSGGITLSLVGLPADNIDAGVMDRTRAVVYQGKAVRVLMGFCNLQTGAPFPAIGLVEIWSGYADVMTFGIGDTVSATLTCDHFSTRMLRANGLRMTSESHNARLGNPATKDLIFEPQNRLMGRAKPKVIT